MRNALAFLAAAVLVIAAVGWYLDWFEVRTMATGGGRQTVKIDIDTNKIGTDLQRGGEKVIDRAGPKVQQAIDRASKQAVDEAKAQAAKQLSGN